MNHMAKNVRALLRFPRVDSYEEFESTGQSLMAACPEADLFRDEEVEEFFILAYLIEGTDLRNLKRRLRKAGLTVPPRLHFDPYRLGRYAIRRSWEEPTLRPRLLKVLGHMDFKNLIKLRTTTEMKPFLALFHGQGPLGALWLLRQAGLADRIPALMAALTPGEAAWYRGQRLHVRYMLHRMLTEPDHADGRITMQEQRQIIRRIRHHDTQLRSLRRSLYTLTGERKALLAAVRSIERETGAALTQLTANLEQLRLDLALAERRHAEVMTERAARHAVEAGQLQARVEEEQADQAAAMAERQRWAPARPLAGRRVAVVGAESREADFRSRIERLGGTLVHFSGTDRLLRLSEGLGDADIIILMTADMKHAAEWLVRKVAPAGAMVLRCPAAGGTSLERVLGAEVLPRLTAAALDALPEVRQV